jgi:hypothetical protein
LVAIEQANQRKKKSARPSSSNLGLRRGGVARKRKGLLVNMDEDEWQEARPRRRAVDGAGAASAGHGEKPSHYKVMYGYRVRRCRNHEQGLCENGDHDCFDAHTPALQRRCPYRSPEDAVPNVYTGGRCRDLPTCPRGAQCPHSHSELELSYHPGHYKTKKCVHDVNSTTNACMRNGRFCPFAHGDDDVRPPRYAHVDGVSSGGGSSGGGGTHGGTEELLPASEFDYVSFRTRPCYQRNCITVNCNGFHNPRERRRNPTNHYYVVTPCPFVHSTEGLTEGQSRRMAWGDPAACPLGDDCEKAHSADEPMYHPELYKSVKCSREADPKGCAWASRCSYRHHADPPFDRAYYLAIMNSLAHDRLYGADHALSVQYKAPPAGNGSVESARAAPVAPAPAPPPVVVSAPAVAPAAQRKGAGLMVGFATLLAGASDANTWRMPAPPATEPPTLDRFADVLGNRGGSSGATTNGDNYRFHGALSSLVATPPISESPPRSINLAFIDDEDDDNARVYAGTGVHTAPNRAEVPSAPSLVPLGVSALLTDDHAPAITSTSTAATSVLLPAAPPRYEHPGMSIVAPSPFVLPVATPLSTLTSAPPPMGRGRGRGLAMPAAASVAPTAAGLAVVAGGVFNLNDLMDSFTDGILVNEPPPAAPMAAAPPTVQPLQLDGEVIAWPVEGAPDEAAQLRALLHRVNARRQRLEQRLTCPICYDRECNRAFLPCGHLTCAPCAEGLARHSTAYADAADQRCPQCQQPYTSVAPVYL